MVRLGLILGVGLATGCHPANLMLPSSSVPVQLATMPRGEITTNVTAIAKSAEFPPQRPPHYRRLSAEECRLLAIRNAPLAAELDQHPENTSPSHPHLHSKSSELAERSRLTRGYAADEIRNRSAADALELYYKLAGVEGQSDLLLAAHAFLRPQLAAAEKAIKVGAGGQVEADRIRRQLLDLESQVAKLAVAIAAYNAGLIGALGLDPGDPAPIWPIDPLHVGSEQPDPEIALQTALMQRPDLNGLRSLASGNGSAGGLTNSVLKAANPLLGTSDPTNPIMLLLASLKKEPAKADAKAQQQLLGLLATRQRQAEAEVRATVAAIRGNRNAVAALAAEVRLLESKVAEEEKRLAAGVAGAEEALTTARLDLLKARGELLQAVVNWHIADVRLRQATGVLVREPISAPVQFSRPSNGSESR